MPASSHAARSAAAATDAPELSTPSPPPISFIATTTSSIPTKGDGIRAHVEAGWRPTTEELLDGHDILRNMYGAFNPPGVREPDHDKEAQAWADQHSEEEIEAVATAVAGTNGRRHLQMLNVSSNLSQTIFGKVSPAPPTLTLARAPLLALRG